MRRAMLLPVLLGCAAAGLGAQQAPPAGERLQATVSAQPGYDSNINDNNAAPLAGWEQDLDATLGWSQAGPRGSWSLTYHPYLQLFGSAPQLNSFNQVAAASGAWQPTARWTVQVAGSGGYMEQLPDNTLNGLQPLLAPEVSSAAPRLREAMGQGTGTVGYALSPRLTLALDGGYSELRFPGAGAASYLNRVQGGQTGLGLNFQTTPHTTLGARLGYENFSIGAASHLAAVSLLLSCAHALSPTTHWELAAGPEYTQVHDTVALNLGVATLVERAYRVRTYPRIEATLAHDGAQMSWQAEVGRQVSDGGGALPFPVALLEARLDGGPPRLGRWRVRAGLHVSQLTALASGVLSSRVRMAAAGVEARRGLNRHFSLDLNYNYLLQRSQGGVFPLLPGVNRNQASARLSWSWRPLPETN